MAQNVHDPISSIDQDILERHFLAERIYERLLSDNCPPVIGIYGGWGTGKTSLLNLVRNMADGNPTIQIKYIDAWNYEMAGDLFVPAIVRLLAESTSKLPYLKDYFIKLSLGMLYMAIDGVALRELLNIRFSDVSEYKKQVEAHSRITPLDWFDYRDRVDEIRQAFSQLIATVNKGGRTEKFIFLIDNLDRCSPENVVRLLESVKNFMNIPGCIWIFAIDAGVVASFIDHKYEGTTMDGTNYLDKIIPEQYHISFFPEEHDHRIFELIRSVTGRNLTLSNKELLPLLPTVMVPRRLKKSAVKFAECFSREDSPEADRDTVFLLSLLYHTWPGFYERISSSSEEHIGRCLVNFVDEKAGTAWRSKYTPLPCDKYGADLDVKQFIQTAFLCRGEPEYVVMIVKRAMLALRQVGLP